MFIFRFILIFFQMFCAASFAAPVAPLKTVIGKNMTAPWYMVGKDGEHQGITPDYIRAIEKKLGQKVDILILPKNRIRIGFEKGEIDFNCYTTPEWAGPPSKNFQWSQPLFEDKTVLASIVGPVKSIKAIRGQRIGTVLRYKYPDLKKMFESGKLIRDEAHNEDSNLIKLEFGRFNYALAEYYHLHYYLSKHPNSKIKPTKITLDKTDVRCWVRKGAPLTLEKLNKAIAEIKREGILDKIFDKYRNDKSGSKK